MGGFMICLDENLEEGVMNSGSVGGPDRIELSKISNSGKNSSIDGIGDPVSSQMSKYLANELETGLSGKETCLLVQIMLRLSKCLNKP